MAEKLEDLNLPQAAVLKITKEAIPDNINIGKDVKAALAKAASMFILYMTSQSTQIAQAAKRKTLLPQDIFEALEEGEFGQLVPSLKEYLKEYQGEKLKKEEDKKRDAAEAEAEGEDEEIDDEDDDDTEKDD